MAVYAVVPVKKISVAKSRLSHFLSATERKSLTTAMLKDVLTALKASVVEEVIVVSNDPNVRLIAEKFGVSFFSPGKVGLNNAVEEAMAFCLARQADSVLVLLADIPLLSPKDIDTIVKLGSEGRRVVLSPSEDWGTNAFFMRPPRVIPACFGQNSFLKHVTEACSRGVEAKFYYSANIALDVDSVKDLQKLQETCERTFTRKVLDKIMLEKK